MYGGCGDERAGECLYLYTAEANTPLCDGFMPIHLWVTDTAEALLWELVDKLRACGCDVAGVNTDAVWLRQRWVPPNTRGSGWEELEAFQKKHPEYYYEGKDEFGKIGKLKETVWDADFEFMQWEVKAVENIFRRPKRPKLVTLEVKDEWDLAEIHGLLETGTSVEAGTPGAGKTFPFEKLPKTLIVCPGNKLVRNVVKGMKEDGLHIEGDEETGFEGNLESSSAEGSHSVTYDRFLGIVWNGTVSEEKGRKYNLDRYDHVCFDELYMVPLRHKELVAGVIRENPGKRFFCTFDAEQLAPIERFPMAVDSAAYHLRAVRSMFNRRIYLKENKRCDKVEDRRKIEELASLKTWEERFAWVQRNIRRVRTLDDVKTQRNIVAFHRTEEKVNAHIHGEGKELYGVGQVLVGRGSGTGAARVYCNEEYRVVGRREELVEEGEGGSKRRKSKKGQTVTMIEVRNDLDKRWSASFPLEDMPKLFRLPYASTCHCLQGAKLDCPHTVFDVCSLLATAAWLLVAFSRCTRLSDVSYYQSSRDPSDVDLRKSLQSRIDGHRAADAAAGRQVDEAAYVTVDWAMGALRRQNWRCSSCFTTLDYDGERGVSIDRVDNRLAHYQFNSVLSCARCNVSRGARQLL
jgi:hypothetical protein